MMTRRGKERRNREISATIGATSRINGQPEWKITTGEMHLCATNARPTPDYKGKSWYYNSSLLITHSLECLICKNKTEKHQLQQNSVQSEDSDFNISIIYQY